MTLIAASFSHQTRIRSLSDFRLADGASLAYDLRQRGCEMRKFPAVQYPTGLLSRWERGNLPPAQTKIGDGIAGSRRKHRERVVLVPSPSGRGQGEGERAETLGLRLRPCVRPFYASSRAASKIAPMVCRAFPSKRLLTKMYPFARISAAVTRWINFLAALRPSGFSSCNFS